MADGRKKTLTLRATMPATVYRRFSRLARRLTFTRARLSGDVLERALEALEACVAEWGEDGIRAMLKSGDYKVAIVDTRGPGEDPALAIALEAAERAASDPPEGLDLSYTPPSEVVFDAIIGGAALESERIVDPVPHAHTLTRETTR